MTGKKYIENPGREKVCPTCGVVISRRGYINHTRNCDKDEPLLDPDRDARHPSLRDDEDASNSSAGEDEDSPDPNDTDEPEPTDGVAEGVSVRDTHTPNSHTTDPSGESGEGVDDQETTTDGGRAAPPEPDLKDDADDPVDVDDLPDRYVPVDQYLDEITDQVSDRLLNQYRRSLSGYDVVDVVETRENDQVHAYPLEEVSDA